MKLPSFLVASALALVLLPRGLRADLDVAIPPGTPLEWRFELPFHVPAGERGPIYTHTPAGAKEKEDEKVPRGRTIVAPKVTEVKPPPPMSRFGAFNPMGAARILTMDIIGHMPWTQWRRSDLPPGELEYPPETRADLYWLMLTAFLRPLLHPAKVSRAETAYYLILIGPAVRDAMGTGQGLSGVLPLVQYIEKAIPKVPDQPPPIEPLVSKVGDREVAMLIRWAARELVSDHPYAYNPLYAKRTRSLGGEAIPVLLACSKSEHPILRENATGLLAAFDTYDEEVMGQLRSLSAGKDFVARSRALEALILWHDEQTESMLLKAVAGKDPYFSIYAIQALGRMGSVKARKPIQSRLKVDPGDKGESWMAATVALSRIPDTDGSSLKLIKTVAKVWAKLPPYLEVGAGQGADVPDPVGARAALLVQTAMIAMARLGDEGCRKAFLEHLARASPPVGGARDVLRLEAYDPVLGEIEPFNQILAIEALAQTGDQGREYLRKIVTDSRDFILRGYALDYLLRIGADAEFVSRIAHDDGMPSVLRVAAMEGLERVEASRKDAFDAAKTMVDRYVGKGVKDPAPAGEPQIQKLVPDRAQSIPSYECLAALKLLGRYGEANAESIVAVLKKARAAGDYERFEKGQSSGEAPGGGPVRPGQVNEVTLRAFPALFETAVVELGRLADPKTQGELVNVLKERKGPGRFEAALALGTVSTKAACDSLLEALDDDDPWVRYGAYRSLKKISGESHFADWIFGAKGERDAAVAAWKEWRQKKDGELKR